MTTYSANPDAEVNLLPNTISTTTVVVWAICFGIIIAIIYYSVQISALSKFIKSLVQNECFDFDTAKTLENLGIKNTLDVAIIVSSIKGQMGLSRIIGFKNQKYEKVHGEICKNSPDKQCLFYIDKETSDMALKKYSAKSSSGLITFALCVALIILAFFAEGIINFLTSYSKGVFSGTNKNEVVSGVQNQEQSKEEYDVIFKPDILDEIPTDEDTLEEDKVVGTNTVDDTQDINSGKDGETTSPSIPKPEN